MKGLCTKCSKRSECVELCKEAANYANQDFVSYKIKTVSEIGLNIHNFDEPFDYGTCKSNNRLIYELYFLDGKSIRSIEKYIELSKTQIGRVIKRLKDNIQYKSGDTQCKILKLHFIDKMKQQDISKTLKIDDAYVYSTISDYLIENKVQ